MKGKKKVLLLAYGEMGESVLRSLLTPFSVVGIVTPPEKTSLYRASALLPVERLASDKKIPIYKTDKLDDLHNLIIQLQPMAVVIASFNKVIPKRTLLLSKFINVHHGDLPRFRGRANLNWAIILGRDKMAVTIHDASVDLDAGNIYAQYTFSIHENDTIKTLYDRINKFLAANLGNIVEKVLAGYKGKVQIGEGTYCCTRLPQDGLIDWRQKSLSIDRLIRALTHPFPGAFTFLDGEKMIIWSSEIPKTSRIYEGTIPGRVVAVHKRKGIEVLTIDSTIIIKDVLFNGQYVRADEVIKSVKKTLGFISHVEYERLLLRIKELETKKDSF